MVSNNNLLIRSESVKYNSQNNNQTSQHTIKICCFLNAKKKEPKPKIFQKQSLLKKVDLFLLRAAFSHLDYNIPTLRQ